MMDRVLGKAGALPRGRRGSGRSPLQAGLRHAALARRETP
jgi:hypothetical protein